MEDFGRQAENLVVSALLGRGYRILARNFRGPRYEIDIVASMRDAMVVVEVKMRSGDWIAADLIPYQKRLALMRGGRAAWNRFRSPEHAAIRLDVALVGRDDGQLKLKNYFADVAWANNR